MVATVSDCGVCNASMSSSAAASQARGCRNAAPEAEVVRLRVSIGGSFSQKEDSPWKYIGGDHFLESVPVSWKYADLVFSLAEKVDGAISVKYLLPGEDLDPDALISVADDSDIAEMFDEYFRALKLPGTPIKTFRLRLFLFRAAEVPYTPEDLEAEARYLEMMPHGASPRGGASFALDGSDGSSTRGDETVDGIQTPSTAADAELAWEAGFQAGQEAAMHEAARLANDEQWASVLSRRMTELAQAASERMLGGGWPVDVSPPPSLPAPGFGVGEDDGGAALSVHMADAIDPGLDPEFQSMFESKYEISASPPRRQGQSGAAGGPVAALTSASAGDRSPPSARPSTPVDPAAAAMLSPGALLPTHISIFGDDLGPAEALAVVQRFGPPPAAAANLPSHISEFGGSEEDGHEGAEAVAEAGLPEDDAFGAGLMMRKRREAAAVAPPEAGQLPTHFQLLDNARGGSREAAAAAAAAAAGGVAHQPAGGGNGALPTAPAALPRPSPALSSVHHVDSGSLAVLAKIGEGSFGEVSLCQCPTFGQVAVKWIKSTRMERWTSFWREAELMSRLNHPNVLRFFGLVTQGEFVVGIMTEFAASGSLASFMRGADGGVDGGSGSGRGSGGFLTLKQRAHLALHAANGMSYLHSQRVVHFDVKPDNLLVAGSWDSPDGPVLKVADFGLSVVKANTFCSDVHDLRGTLPYMAPEMITDHKHVTEAADVWSLGVVFWELLTQQQPYADIAPAQLLGALGSGAARLPIPEWCEPQWRALVEACWVQDPALRPTCRQLAVQLQRICNGA